MFRRFRYRRWLVAGLCVAAVVVPSGALAGNNLGAKNGGYGYAVSVTKQAHSLDPAIVKYLLRYGYTESQIAAMSGGTFQAASLDPAIVEYLLRYGYTESQIAAMSGGTFQAASLDPAIVKYLLRYGYTESQIAAMSGGALQVSQPTVVDGRSPDTIDFATQAQEPVVTVVREPGFQWDDFGVGFSAALLALVAIGLSRLFSNRGGRRPATSS